MTGLRQRIRMMQIHLSINFITFNNKTNTMIYRDTKDKNRLSGSVPCDMGKPTTGMKSQKKRDAKHSAYLERPIMRVKEIILSFCNVW